MCWCCVFFVKKKTAYEMRISDWSSDVCSSDLGRRRQAERDVPHRKRHDDRGPYEIDTPCHRASRAVRPQRGRFAADHRSSDFNPEHLPHLSIVIASTRRSEERRVGKEWISQFQYRWAHYL